VPFLSLAGLDMRAQALDSRRPARSWL
jgi:hypothetical protein